MFHSCSVSLAWLIVLSVYFFFQIIDNKSWIIATLLFFFIPYGNLKLEVYLGLISTSTFVKNRTYLNYAILNRISSELNIYESMNSILHANLRYVRGTRSFNIVLFMDIRLKWKGQKTSQTNGCGVKSIAYPEKRKWLVNIWISFGYQIDTMWIAIWNFKKLHMQLLYFSVIYIFMYKWAVLKILYFRSYF